MTQTRHVLGIDIGSVSIAAAILDRDERIIETGSCFHRGDIKGGLAQVLGPMNLDGTGFVAATASTPSVLHRDYTSDDQVSLFRAARRFHDSFRAVLHVGAEKFSLSHFNEAGTYTGALYNTSCAAGTGSFLDQQAARLGLSSSRELSLAACSNRSAIPDIATRCAVFAKTDLIHAQQEGFSIVQICDGLCRGLAQNLYNTLFVSRKPCEPVIFCGGVSRNEAVRRHLEDLTGIPMEADPLAHLYGAIGAGLLLMDDIRDRRFTAVPVLKSIRPDTLLKDTANAVTDVYPALKLTMSTYPDFYDHQTFVRHQVENDIYQVPANGSTVRVTLGIDVGSTSTKAVLVDDTRTVLAGFYTRTASRPVEAVQRLLKCMDDFIRENRFQAEVAGCGTTGSGRKLSGTVIGADLRLDEITAHARAACQLNPDVDTIIEIGGQDAKFTTLKNGMVTFSLMNTVCAAGTGSFIEEQAAKLGCMLTAFSERTESVSAPISSDRCTVFMERDINHFLSEGHSVDEVLASALHSVRDNYLTKVAVEGRIGDTILFQGATAKNRALIAAFEQRLKKPIHVSRYCHLTGALGVALTLQDQDARPTTFRGFDLWRQPIPVRQETCQLCTNHCKLTLADVEDQTVAYGFLCGRDYGTDHYVAQGPSFNLIKARSKAIRPPAAETLRPGFTIGIPAALHLVEDLSFWQVFFNRLGIRTVTSAAMKHPIKAGKTLANAEFCAPITAMHGHVSWLADRADRIFLPFYFESRKDARSGRRQYCYYTQYLPSVISQTGKIDKSRLIMPNVKYLYTTFHTRLQLYKTLKDALPWPVSFFDISMAWDRAVQFRQEEKERLERMYQENRTDTDINILLVGRPYTVLSKSLNNRIPDIFSNLDVPVFFQDMLSTDDLDTGVLEELFREIHWEHVATILKATLIAARTENLYPVYVTSFKCSPDSFGVDYFKTIMEAFDKPYLVLELDEHDSSIGYETRIEAAIRAFRNHRTAGNPKPDATLLLKRIAPDLSPRPGNQTIVIPNWDPLTGRLLAATLRGQGHNALLMEETPQTIRRSMAFNTGQCTPLNAIAAGYMNTIERHGLEPEETVLYLFASDIACNIKLYPHHIRNILKAAGSPMDRAGVHRGNLTFSDISIQAAVNAYFSYMFGGLLRSIGCRLRPYEINAGQTDAAIQSALTILCRAFEGKLSREEALAEALTPFARIPVREEKRPKVGIFGDFYVRDNPIMNQNLIRFIEDHGGEVITTPYYRFAKMIAPSYFSKWFKEGKYFDLISNRTLLAAMKTLEKKYYRYFEPILHEPEYDYPDSAESILGKFGVLPEHTGESMDNLIKIHYLLKEHPDMALFVQTSPSYCCPALVTEAMAAAIEDTTGVPVVSVTYDASGGSKNRVIIPFLQDAGRTVQPHSFRKSV